MHFDVEFARLVDQSLQAWIFRRIRDHDFNDVAGVVFHHSFDGMDTGEYVFAHRFFFPCP